MERPRRPILNGTLQNQHSPSITNHYRTAENRRFHILYENSLQLFADFSIYTYRGKAS
jgi:hypothetical protein